MFFDPVYLLFIGPAALLAGYASLKTKSTFKRYGKVRASSGITGAQAAQKLMQNAGIHNVGVEMTQGFLSDHYDPRSKTLRLSPDVYQSPSLSAIGVACHEAGHALQDAKHYAPLKLRSAMVPATSFGSKLSMPIIIGGVLLSSYSKSPMGGTLMIAGIILFSLTVLFSLVTLPVEWDASARAKKLMVQAGIVSVAESSHAGKVLNAAFLTYVAAAVSALMTLLYYLYRSGLLGGRR